MSFSLRLQPSSTLVSRLFSVGLLAACLTLNVACDGEGVGEDAGEPAVTPEPDDGGAVDDDGGAVDDDAGRPDDAGTENDDAGTENDDAGSENGDAGNADAGDAGDDAGAAGDDAGEVDGGSDMDAGVVDAGPSADGGSDVDAGAGDVDAGAPPPVVTEGYGVDPARCGQAPYSWLDSSAVGSVLEDEDVVSMSAFFINIVLGQLENQGAISLDRTPSRDVNVRRIRYQTQDRGHLIDATGLVGIPTVDSTEELPVLLFLHGTTGLSDVCAPSRDPLGDTIYETQLVGLLASLGYIVVAPDYIGMKSMGDPSPELHPYLMGEPTAIASLDMVRAVQQLVAVVQPDLVPGPVVVNGASQGGHAAAFTTRFLPHYAPELDVRGAVWGIPPTNLAGHVDIALRSLSNPTANTVGWALAANDWYASDPNGLSSIFVSPYDVDLPQQARAECGLSSLEGNVNTLEDLFVQELLDAAQNPGIDGYAPWDCMAREGSLPTTTVPRDDDIPALFVIGANDTLVDPQVERESFTTLCAQGYELEFLECAGAGHSDGYLYSLDDQFDFLEARLAGAPMPASTCSLQMATTCSSTP